MNNWLFSKLTGYRNPQHWFYWRVYLRSPAWSRTRAMILRRDNHRCKKCGTQVGLQVHHVNYIGTPYVRFWHFLPFARLFIWRVDDKSTFETLCGKHHAMTYAKPKTKGSK